VAVLSSLTSSIHAVHGGAVSPDAFMAMVQSLGPEGGSVEIQRAWFRQAVERPNTGPMMQGPRNRGDLGVHPDQPLDLPVELFVTLKAGNQALAHPRCSDHPPR
jgi:hypothetical protein